MNIKRILAIFYKELQDIKSNSNITVMFLIPILLTYLWENLIPGMPSGMGLSLGMMFLIVMVGMYVPAMLIAEEKEKNTIEVLLFSPATSLEILIGKGLLTFTAILIISLLLLVLTGIYSQLFIIFTGVFLTTIFSIATGMIVGLLSPNQMATGVIGTPVYLILLLVPNLSIMDIEIMQGLGKVLPTYYFLNMMRFAIEGKGFAEMYTELAVIGGSVVIALLVLLYIFQRKGFRN